MQAELYWIDGPWPGRLAIMPRPRGGDWLEEEIASWQRAGFDTIVSTLTTEETAELDLAREEELCEGSGRDFVSFPIPDRYVPCSAKEVLGLVRRLVMELSSGGRVGIHCRQGVGRSALIAACILAASGVDPASAWERIAAARRCVVPDTNEQREWVARFVRDKLAPVSGGKAATSSVETPLRSGGES